ncbi:MAG: hypothetical protein ACUVTU_03870 [Desulfurispora sp.]|uniref:hypothetical protein n=1 Tax=Desulfurispora sp. TaxID=3014275 RepID=UPI00404A1DD6
MSSDYTYLALFVNYTILLFMLGSGVWVAWDAYRSGRPASEVIAWGLFALFFVGLGLIVYLYWRKKMPPTG